MSGSLAAFACGVILLYTFPILPPLPWLMGAAAFLLCGAVRFRSRWGRPVVCWALALLAGVGWAAWHASDRVLSTLPASLEGQVLSVSGYLCDIPSHGSFNSLRFNVCVTRWNFSGDQDDPMPQETRSNLPGKIRLAWYGSGEKVLPGQRLQLQVVLKKPHGAVNPAGFRYETWLFRHGFGATGTVREVVADDTVTCGLHCRYMAWRHQLADSVASVMGEAQHYPLLASLLIGHRGEMTPEHWEVLKATGTIHLVAISGLHLGLVAVGAGFLARRVVNGLPVGWFAPVAQRYLVLVFIALGSLAYALAAGFTVPTRRALIMVMVAGWVLVKGQQVSPWSGLVLALFLVVLLDPFAPLDQGFWLSFGAVSVLVLVFAGRLAAPNWLSALVLAQVAVFAGLWPILSALGQGQPYAGLLANLFAIPWVSFVVMPLLMGGSALLWLIPASRDWVLTAFDGVMDVLWQVLSWLASQPIPSGNPGVVWAAVVSILVLAGLVIPATRLRWGLALSSVLVFGGAAVWDNRQNPWVERAEVYVWDVGQGLSVLVRHHDQVLLYDSGPAVPGVFSAVESVVMPNLRRLGVERIDTLVISHADSDHAGGLPALFSAMPVSEVITGEPARLLDLDGGYHPGPVPAACSSREPMPMGKLILQFWQSPDAAAAGNANDTSCVVTIRQTDGPVQLILPGDITAGVEKELIEAGIVQNTVGTPSDKLRRVVVAPHHGSNTSSSHLWVRALAPEWVIYSAGYRHRFGHPHPAVVERYRNAGVRQLNTAYSGAIHLELNRGGIEVHQQRAVTPFWIRGPITDW